MNLTNIVWKTQEILLFDNKPKGQLRNEIIFQNFYKGQSVEDKIKTKISSSAASNFIRNLLQEYFITLFFLFYICNVNFVRQSERVFLSALIQYRWKLYLKQTIKSSKSLKPSRGFRF